MQLPKPNSPAFKTTLLSLFRFCNFFSPADNCMFDWGSFFCLTFFNVYVQQAYYRCAYECFDRRRNQEEIGRCVEHCSVPVHNAQNLFQNEMAKFQVKFISFYVISFFFLLNEFEVISKTMIMCCLLLAQSQFYVIRFDLVLILRKK